MEFHKNCVIVTTLLLSALLFARGVPKVEKAEHPNILFIIIDDAGIDRFRSFGYGGEEQSRTPVMDTLASGGLRFRNVWSTPECSPSRALIFTGRYPLRTNIRAALQPMDLANSQLSPYEMTSPKLLKHAGYTSALFGKFHMGGPHNNPYAEQSPMSAGFDYFHGPMGWTSAGAMPDPIDTTAGGVNATGPYDCGFVPNKDTDPVHGADNGACYFADSRDCSEISRTSAEPHPGRACLEQGGIFVPDATCQADRPFGLDFDLTNAYYVWSLGETDLNGTIGPIPLTDGRSRTYWPTEVTNAAIEWINGHQNGPWMVTVAYPSIHAPYQQAPQSLTPSWDDCGATCCSCEGDSLTLSDQMLQAMDAEVGRLLVETGVASRTSGGQLDYRPDDSNTMIVIVSDNGTYAPVVKAPFDQSRSKGTVFQTGVWVPLIVAGPMVESPNRDVESMVNLADLFELFGEIAGLDVHKIVPSSHVLDSVSMLPYLREPSHPSLRRYNFTQTGINTTAYNQRPRPCVLPYSLSGTGRTCLQLMSNQETCEAEGGTWYGESYQSCCELKEAGVDVELCPIAQAAVRNDKFKLVQTTYEVCSPQNATSTVYDLYEIDQAVPSPKLDRVNANLITSQSSPTQGLTQEQARNFKLLERELRRILESETTCPGDGNYDGIVDKEDIRNWSLFNGKGSSWYDFPAMNPDGSYVYDGVTDESDLQVILDNLGRKCPR